MPRRVARPLDRRRADVLGRRKKQRRQHAARRNVGRRTSRAKQPAARGTCASRRVPGSDIRRVIRSRPVAAGAAPSQRRRPITRPYVIAPGLNRARRVAPPGSPPRRRALAGSVHLRPTAPALARPLSLPPNRSTAVLAVKGQALDRSGPLRKSAEKREKGRTETGLCDSRTRLVQAPHSRQRVH